MNKTESILRKNPDFARQIDAQMAGQPASEVKRKWNNKPVVLEDGTRYDSTKEYRNHLALCALHGEKNMMRQLSIKIGKKRMVVDHARIVERYPDGSFRLVLMDTKGAAPTPEWKVKAVWLEEKYGITIEII